MTNSAEPLHEMDATPEPLAFGQRLVSLLEFGRRNSTYKLATLMSIIDVCTENGPGPDGSLHVQIQELAHRVVAYYWRQSRPYTQSGVLRQNSQASKPFASIGQARASLSARGLRTAEAAREAEDPEYLRLVRKIELLLAQMPLTHLQSITGAPEGDDFIYDASGLHKKMTRAQLDAHGPIVLRPGVPDAIRRLAPLLRPVIEIEWSADVAKLNKAELDTDDLPGFLFGQDRIGLARITQPLRELQDGRCFYCDAVAGPRAEVDHVLPWSKIPINGVANLVLTDRKCNGDKSATLPVREHVDRALARSALDLEVISTLAGLPVLLDRTHGATIGIYQSLPSGTPLWLGRNQYLPS